MLKIGDFSKLSGVSIRMLRYYDEIGLLKPVRIDPDTGITQPVSLCRRGASMH